MDMDPELIERAQRGDAAAVTSMVADSSQRLMAVAYSILRDHDQAEEATQRALIAVWQHLPSLRDAGRYEAWSYRLVVNACNAELRGRRRFRDLSKEPMVQPSFVDDLGLVAERDQLDRAFLRLPTRQRAVVALRFHLGLSPDGVAEVLGVPVGTVHSRLHRAMDVLRGAIDADARGMTAESQIDRPLGAGLAPRARPWRPELVLSWHGGPGARRIVVSPDGWGDARSIAEALDLAADGDIILVRPGRYHETPVVRKHVAIVGDGDARDVVVDFRDGAPTHWCGTGIPRNCPAIPVGFTLEGVEARISNLTLRGPEHGVGIFTRGGSPTITHVSTDFDQRWAGVGHNHHFLYMKDATSGRLSDCTSRAHVQIGGSWLGRPSIGASPIIEHNDLGGALVIVGAGSRPLVRENALVVRQRTRACLSISAGAQPTIEHNVLSWFDGAAVSIRDAARPTVKDNVIRDSQTGIRVFERGGGSLEGSEIEARTTAVAVHGADPFLSGNVLRGNGTAPLVVSGDARPVFEANQVEGVRPTVRPVHVPSVVE
jgi:RNA polymerase sigma-70 factor (ECF subfamily)